MANSKFRIKEYASAADPAPASPSSSIVLVSPDSKILLLHRLRTSSAFPSAHVFPGGNLEASDGEVPSDPRDVQRHVDSAAYRHGAIRELFEETGILLARASRDTPSLLAVDTAARQEGRKAVHGGKIRFDAWLRERCATAVLDADRLIPFTHWVTPANVPKRFTTQMYIYFVDFAEAGNPSIHATSDEVENMSVDWARAHEWCERQRKGEIILFPPQYLLLSLVSEVLDKGFHGQQEAQSAMQEKRRELETVIKSQWKDKYISPIGIGMAKDGRQVLGLDKPGLELVGSQLKGDDQRAVLVRFSKAGPREVEVRWRKDMLAELRETAAAAASKAKASKQKKEESKL